MIELAIIIVAIIAIIAAIVLLPIFGAWYREKKEIASTEAETERIRTVTKREEDH